MEETRENVRVERKGSVFIVEICRPHKRNAVDFNTAKELAAAFREFESDTTAKCAVLCGSHRVFCSGADLSMINNRVAKEGDGPMGISRMLLSKPLICAIEGYAVAGGLELALLGDIRICDEESTFGVFCRRFGVPLIDGGTVRLPRTIGRGPALYMILTGNAVSAPDALRMGLVSEVVQKGKVKKRAEELAKQISNMPEDCMLSDRSSVYEQEDLTFKEAMANEFQHGEKIISSPAFKNGPARFAKGGEGRHGSKVQAKL